MYCYACQVVTPPPGAKILARMASSKENQSSWELQALLKKVWGLCPMVWQLMTPTSEASFRVSFNAAYMHWMMARVTLGIIRSPSRRFDARSVLGLKVAWAKPMEKALYGLCFWLAYLVVVLLRR